MALGVKGMVREAGVLRDDLLDLDGSGADDAHLVSIFCYRIWSQVFAGDFSLHGHLFSASIPLLPKVHRITSFLNSI